MQPLPLCLLSKPQRSGCPDGGLNAGEPLTLRPHGGMGGFSWAVAGFLLGQGEATITDDDKARVAREIGSTFATSFAPPPRRTCSLADLTRLSAGTVTTSRSSRCSTRR